MSRPGPHYPMETQRAMLDTHPMRWCIRRELWENRSIYLAPLIVAAIVIFVSFIGILGAPKKLRHPMPDAAKQHTAIVKPFSMAPAPIMLTTFIVGMFFAIDALYGERRDRSILFWKSLPVSDATTVLSKMSIPLVVLPSIGFALSIVAFFFILFATTGWVMVNGINPARLWREVHFIEEPMVMIYGLIVHSLWFAPIYAWLLLISAWAKRLPLLWVVLPAMGIGMFERMIFNTAYFGQFIKYRIVGAMGLAFRNEKHNGVIEYFTQLDPIRFLTSPGLWLGLLFAAACLAAAIRLRHNREPI